MAYVPITVDDFTERFPQFASMNPDVLDLLLAETLARVDDSWLEQDYRTAQFYYMAHLCTLENASASGTDTAGPIQSESFSGMSRSYAVQTVTSSAAAQLQSTSFGRRFKELRDLNFPGVAVA